MGLRLRGVRSGKKNPLDESASSSPSKDQDTQHTQSNTRMYACMHKRARGAGGLRFQESGKCKRIFVHLCTRLLC